MMMSFKSISVPAPLAFHLNEPLIKSNGTLEVAESDGPTEPDESMSSNEIPCFALDLVVAVFGA